MWGSSEPLLTSVYAKPLQTAGRTLTPFPTTTKMFPEAHFNFAMRFSAVYCGFVFLTNMKHALLNDIPAFMALPLFSLSLLYIFLFPSPLSPGFLSYASFIPAYCLLLAQTSGTCTSHSTPFSPPALICTHTHAFPSLLLPAALQGTSQRWKSRGKESSLNAPFTKTYEISMWL